MRGDSNYILQITDVITARAFAVRLDPDDASLPLASLLDKYVKRCPIELYLSQSRLTQQSAEALQVVQDLLYYCSDSGQLHGIYPGVVFNQSGTPIALDDPLEPVVTHVGETAVAVIDIAIDRTNVGYDRNWAGFHKRRWDRHADDYFRFVMRALRREYSQDAAESILRLDSGDDKIKLVRSVGRTIWDSDFESYSRFIGLKLPYKTGDETVRNIAAGGGGICSEKVQALKFITDHFGIESEYLMAGADTRTPPPEDRLRELLTTFDFRFSRRYMRYWQHTALLYTIDGTKTLVDVTNGNVPFLFMQDEAAERLLGYENKQAVPVRMAVYEEEFYYHRVSQDIPEDLFFALEGWIEDVDLIQVFDNELGLYISSDFFVTPIVYRSPEAFQRLERQYAQVCRKAGLECSVNEDWNLDTPLGQRFQKAQARAANLHGPRPLSSEAAGPSLQGDAPGFSTTEKILQARDHLVERYDECHGSDHDAGLVIVALRGNEDELPDSR